MRLAIGVMFGLLARGSCAGFGKPSVPPKPAAVPALALKQSGVPTFAASIPSLKLDAFPEVRQLHADPPVFEIPNFFSAAECDAYVEKTERADALQMNSQAYSSLSKRTSTTWYLPFKTVPELLSRAERLTGVPLECYEEPQVVRYETGQQFSWHLDALPPPVVKAQAPAGNRLGTLIVYLNTLPSSAGGATSFQDLKLAVKPEKGKALLFFPCFADGRSDDRTTHCGQVSMETKWIAQIWIRQGPYAPALPPGNSHSDGRAAVQSGSSSSSSSGV